MEEMRGLSKMVRSGGLGVWMIGDEMMGGRLDGNGMMRGMKDFG